NRRTERALYRLREILASEDVGRLERFELIRRIGTDRRHFAEVKLRTQLCVLRLWTRGNDQFDASGQIPVCADREMIRTWRYVSDRKPAIGPAFRFARQRRRFDDDDRV